jgi:hypothetical protein
LLITAQLILPNLITGCLEFNFHAGKIHNIFGKERDGERRKQRKTDYCTPTKVRPKKQYWFFFRSTPVSFEFCTDAESGALNEALVAEISSKKKNKNSFYFSI